MAIEFISGLSVSGNSEITGTLVVTNVVADNSTYTGIMVWDGGVLKYRTKAQILSDIGATGNTGTVTSVTVQGSSGLSGSGTVTTSGTITLTNSDRGSSQAIYKNIATQSGTATANSNNDTLTITGTGGTTTSRSGDTITINSTDTTTNYYLTSLSFNTSTGVLTAARNGLSSVTVDLDGRYATSSGVTSIATSNGITGGTITSTGTIQLDSTVIRTTGDQTKAGNLTIYGSGSTGNALSVTRGSDGANAFRVQNSGEVVIGANYLYASASGTSMYVQNTAVFRGGIINDASNAPVLINDSLKVDVDLEVAGGDITLGGTGRIQGVDTVSSGTDATNKTYVDNAISNHRPAAPGAPTNVSASVVGQTIEVVFGKSSSNNIDYYQVWSSDDGADFGIIGQVPPDDFSGTMTIVDTTFNTSGTMSYRIYAVKEGVYSSPSLVSQAYTAGALSVINMSVIELPSAYYVQYDLPLSRFIDHIEIYMDSATTQGALSRSNASLVYSGMNSSYMHSVGASRNFHQFWVEVITT